MCGFDHAMILSPHFPQSQQGTPGTMTPFVYKIRQKTPGVLLGTLGGGVRHAS